MNTNDFIQSHISDDLEHHGVKGMKWGKRKQKQTAKLREKFKDGSHIKSHKSGEMTYYIRANPGSDPAKSWTKNNKDVSKKIGAKKLNEINRKEHYEALGYKYRNRTQRYIDKKVADPTFKVKAITIGTMAAARIALYISGV